MIEIAAGLLTILFILVVVTIIVEVVSALRKVQAEKIVAYFIAIVITLAASYLIGLLVLKYFFN